jgi:uncharacterized phage protein (TIGR01671 family)
MKDTRFRVWHLKDRRMYYRGYQKFLHALLCEDDRGENGGKGRPVKRAGYADCVFLESTGLTDRFQREIFEGDVIRVRHAGGEFTGVVDAVPDTFGSRVHPLAALFRRHGVPANPERIEVEILGNEYENPELAGGQA